MNEWELRMPIRAKTAEEAIRVAREKAATIRVDNGKVWMITKIDLEDELENTISVNANPVLSGAIYFQTRTR